MKFQDVQNASFEENTHENEWIRVMSRCAISLIAHANMGTWVAG